MYTSIKFISKKYYEDFRTVFENYFAIFLRQFLKDLFSKTKEAILVAVAHAGSVMNNQADQSADQPVEAAKPQAMDIARLVKRWWGGDQQAEKELQKRADQMVSSGCRLNIRPYRELFGASGYHMMHIIWTILYGHFEIIS